MKIRDCCYLQEGYVNPSQKDITFFGEEIKWLRASDLNNLYVFDTERKLSQKGFKSAGKSALLFKPNTLAISKSGTIGQIGILKDYMCGNRAVINIEPITDKVDLMFLYYWLLKNRELVVRKATGSIQKNLYVSLLGDFELGTLSIDSQKSIAGSINPLTEKLQINTVLIKTIEEYAQLVFHKWFVDFNFPDDAGKPYRTSGGKMMTIDNVEVPSGWSYGSYTEIGKFVGGGTPSSAHEEYYASDGIPWLTPKDLSDRPQMYTARGERDISELGLNKSSAVLLPSRSVLMSSRAPIGYITIAKNPICTNQGFKSFIPDDDRYSEFIYFSLLHKMNKIILSSSGSTFSEVSKGMMERLKTIIPDKDILIKYYEHMKPLFDKIDIITTEQKLLSQSRDLLIKKLLK